MNTTLEQLKRTIRENTRSEVAYNRILGLALAHSEQNRENRTQKQVEEKPWPQRGDKYWYVDGGYSIPDCWEGEINDEFRKSQQNIFKTEEASDAEIKRLENIAEIRQWLEEKNDGWVPDWGDIRFNKWYFTNMHYEGKIGYNNCAQYQTMPDWKYAKSDTTLIEMLKAFPKEKLLQFIEA